MKLGFGLYANMLDDDHFAFARQCGATHIVAHLTDYFHQRPDVNGSVDQPTGTVEGWGFAKEEQPWSREFLKDLRDDVERHGMKLEALENFSPGFWYDVLLDGPRRDEQMAGLKQFIRDMGHVGIPVMGYNFSIGGVAGRERGPWARGGAEAVGLDGPSEHLDAPIPNGMVWNMRYAKGGIGFLPEMDRALFWDRYKRFLSDLLPVAEDAGVTLAAHPEDPPMERVRRQPRLVYQPSHFHELLSLSPSKRHRIELCLGTVAEMTEGDVYDTLDQLTAQRRVGYIHLRNVKGKVPYYKETFVDDGDIDVPRVIGILKKNRYDGVIIPDHAPQMTCAAPWHSGMAYAMGYLRALMDSGR